MIKLRSWKLLLQEERPLTYPARLGLVSQGCSLSSLQLVVRWLHGKTAALTRKGRWLNKAQPAWKVVRSQGNATKAMPPFLIARFYLRELEAGSSADRGSLSDGTM